MKKSWKRKKIAFFAGCAALFLLGGCSAGITVEELREREDLAVQVTYYANGGTFDGTPDVKQMYYKDGAKILEIGATGTLSGTATLTRSKHEFDGWYYVLENAQGEPLFEDAEKTKPKLGQKAVFPLTADSSKDAHVHLAARWIAETKINVVLTILEEADKNAQIYENGKTAAYTNGATVTTMAFQDAANSDGVVQKPGGANATNYQPFKLKKNASSGYDYTFIEYYWDAACTKPVSFPVYKEDENITNKEQDVTLYARYVKGDWTVLRSKEDVGDMMKNTQATKRYWLNNDIDATGLRVTINGNKTSPAPFTEFGFEIQGNNHTVSNLKIEKTVTAAHQAVSLFGEIKSTAIIKDLTVSNLQIEYKMNLSQESLYGKVYFAFTSIEAGAQITNVKLSGTVVRKNLQGQSIVESIRSYGDEDTYATDGTYETQNPDGFKVTQTNVG